MAVKRTVNFVKTTAIGGLVVILPLAILLFVLGEIVFTLYTVSFSIIESERTPDFVRDNPFLVIASGLGILVGACFVTGLIVQTRLGQYLKRQFMNIVVDRIPIFRALTRITERFAGIEGEDFRPVEVEMHNAGITVLGFVVERLPDDRCVVYVPTSPVTTVGNVMIVAPDKLRYLDTGISETLGAVSQWGVEARRLYEGKPAGSASE